MKKHFLALFVAVAALTVSCSDDDNNNAGGNSRDIKYEITGNFSGTMTAVYTTSSGGNTAAEVTSLPWDLEQTMANDVVAAGFGVSGSGGEAGEQVEIKVYRGGSEVSSTEATANSSGIFTATAPSIVF